MSVGHLLDGSTIHTMLHTIADNSHLTVLEELAVSLRLSSVEASDAVNRTALGTPVREK
ncbi:MAG: hypothetical protein IJP82_04700 [Bacteroidaceae bacterium]|nr:hypothetical protein [Bacteroidaceae bacterium]